MDNEVLQDIVDYAKNKLMAKYGYCGIANSPDMVMLNCDDKAGNDIKINITVKPE